MYALIQETPDYTNIEFSNDLSKLEEMFDYEVEKAKSEGQDSYVGQIGLIEVGEGSVQIQSSVDCWGENILLKSWNIYE